MRNIKSSIKLAIISIGVILLLSVNSRFALASPSPRTNFAIIDSILSVQSKILADEVARNSAKSLSLSIESHPAQIVVVSKLTQFAANRFAVVSAQEKADSKLQITINEIRVSYSADSIDSDSLVRNVKVGLTAVITDNKGELRNAPTPCSLYSDRIARSAVSAIESDDFRFCHATVPDKPKTFLEEIATPAIAVGATLVSLILLFTVRSK
jgi:hypothetical protein